MFYGWWIVVVAAIGMFLGYGAVFNFTFSVFARAIGQEFQWSRSALSVAYSLSLITYAIAMPLVGRWADRYGARKVIIPSVIGFGLCLISLHELSARLWHFYVVCLLMGAVGAGSTVVTYFGVIAHWFNRRRGLALGLAMIGVGLSNFTMPSLVQALIEHVGWRHTYLLVGLAVLLVPLPVGLLLKEKPAMMGTWPDGQPPVEGNTNTSGLAIGGLSGRESLSTGTFWLMFTAVFLVAVSVIGCLIHLVPMLVDRGMTAQAAAFATSLFGGAVIPGRVGSGYLLDRYFASRVAVGFFSGAALGIFLLWSGASGGLAYLAAFLVGMGMGAEGEIMAYLVSRYFGLRSFSEVFGYMMISFTAGGIVGPPIMGLGFDVTGSYRLVLGIFLIAVVVGTFLMTRLGPYRNWESPSEDG
ncbi:MAG: MFS transporter [Acidobacteriota bacterium]|nr:MFS transporter [Acidobacteriota bacterium]